MASVRKKDRSPYYTACFKDEQGVPQFRSTKTTNKKDALRIADEWEDAWRKKVTTHQAKEVLNNILERIGSGPIRSMTLNQLFDAWLSEKHLEVAVGTYDQYLGVVKSARQHLGSAAEKDVTDVTRGDLIAARDSLSKATSESAANKLVDHLRMAFKYAVDNEFLDRSPAVKLNHVVIPDGSKNDRRGLMLTEVRRILPLASILWHGLIMVGLYTGQRLGDVVRLTWGKLEKCADGEGDSYMIIAVR